MKKNCIVFLLLFCLFAVSCEDPATRYLVIPVNTGMVCVDEDFKEEIRYAKIVSSAKGICSHGFSGCTNLTRVTIEEGPTVIGDYAFEQCNSLNCIYISKTITSIGEHAFHNCERLNRIYYSGTQEEWEKLSKGKDWKDPERTCTVCFSDSTYKDI